MHEYKLTKYTYKQSKDGFFNVYGDGKFLTFFPSEWQAKNYIRKAESSDYMEFLTLQVV